MKEATPELLAKCAKGDQGALSEFYYLIAPMMLGACSRYYINREDRVLAVNTAFIKIVDHLKKALPTGSQEAWYRRILMNTIIDEHRKNKKLKELEKSYAELPPAAELSREEMNEAEEHWSAEEVERLLLELPPATRMVFNLFAIEGFNHQEIAEQLGISDGTSKWHVAKAREILKVKLAEKQTESLQHERK